MRLAQHRDEKARRGDHRQGRRIAAHLLEAAAADIEFAAGRFRVKGTDRAIGLFESRPPRRTERVPEDLRGPLAANATRPSSEAALPLRLPCLRGRGRSVHRRGRDRALRRSRRRRPRGQSDDRPRPDPRRHRAGLGPGAARALPSTIPAAGSCSPARSWTMRCRAPTTCRRSTPRSARCRRPRHPLGVRPAGEGGTTPALARRSINAIVDALEDFGVRHVEMPATPRTGLASDP